MLAPVWVDVYNVAGEHLLVGSILGPSVLLKTIKVEEELPAEGASITDVPAAVVDNNDTMDFDDDDGAYFGASVSVLSSHVT